MRLCEETQEVKWHLCVQNLKLPPGQRGPQQPQFPVQSWGVFSLMPLVFGVSAVRFFRFKLHLLFSVHIIITVKDRFMHRLCGDCEGFLYRVQANRSPDDISFLRSKVGILLCLLPFMIVVLGPLNHCVFVSNVDCRCR